MERKIKKIHHTFYTENKLKGRYKMFALLPAITICRDFGRSAWEFYFEWLWFQVSYQIETEREHE